MSQVTSFKGFSVEIKQEPDGFGWEIDAAGNILTSGSVFASKEEALEDALEHYEEFYAIFGDLFDGDAA